MADIARIQGEFATGDSVLLTNQDGSILAIGKAITASSCFVPGLTDEIIKYERVLA
jgi:archaeosine-15-forming tRNA-guanine transglycosylase